LDRLGIGILSNQEIKKSSNQEIKKSRSQEIKKSRNQEIKRGLDRLGIGILIIHFEVRAKARVHATMMVSARVRVGPLRCPNKGT